MSPLKEKEPLNRPINYTITSPDIPQSVRGEYLSNRKVSQLLESELETVKKERAKSFVHAADFWDRYVPVAPAPPTSPIERYRLMDLFCIICMFPRSINDTCLDDECHGTRQDPDSTQLERRISNPVTWFPTLLTTQSVAIASGIASSVAALTHWGCGFGSCLTITGSVACSLGMIPAAVCLDAGIGFCGKTVANWQHNATTGHIIEKIQSIIDRLQLLGDTKFDVEFFCKNSPPYPFSATLKTLLLSAMSIIQIHELKIALGETEFQTQYGSIITPETMRCLDFLQSLEQKQDIKKIQACLIQFERFLEADLALWEALIIRLDTECLKEPTILGLFIKTRHSIHGSTLEEVHKTIMTLSENAHIKVSFILKNPTGYQTTYCMALAPLLRYDYFSRMFSSGFREAEKKEVVLELSREEQEAFPALIEYATTKKLEASHVFALFHLANKFEMLDLYSDCYVLISTFFKNDTINVEDLDSLFLLERDEYRDRNRKLLVDTLLSTDRIPILRSIFTLASKYEIDEVLSALTKQPDTYWTSNKQHVKLIYEFEAFRKLHDHIKKVICNCISNDPKDIYYLNHYRDVPPLCHAIKEKYIKCLNRSTFKLLWEHAEEHGDEELKSACLKYYENHPSKSDLALLWNNSEVPPDLIAISIQNLKLSC